jgi:TolB-like protein/DNA-binding winged helix-turn-helix (wHTH) protein/tetratricopeptide (TPR) repeat protein
MRGVVRFESFEVDLRAGEVRKHGHRLRLQDQPFRILQVLLEHPGEVVTREELQQQIWPSDTFVDFERGLNNAVKRLREALGDSAEKPRYVETLPKRGYRFIGALEARNGDSRVAKTAKPIGEPEEAALKPKPRLLIRAMAFAVIGVLLASALAFGMDIGRLRSRMLLKLHPPGIHSLAVIPLQNLSGDPSQEYFADGMTDALITDLAQVSSLKVISRTSILSYKKTAKTLPEIARELNVDGIVEGTVQRSGDRVRITAQLIHGSSDQHLWASSYEGDLRDVFSLERSVTQDIARQIQAHLTPPQNRPPAVPPRPVNVKALEAYLQGKYHLDRVGQGFGDEENRKAAEYFQQAIDADPNFVQAYVGMVDSHSGLLLPSSGDASIIRKAEKKILELDPNSSNGALYLAGQKVDDWDWEGAEKEYRKAIEVNPNDVEVHKSFARFLDDLGRLDEGWKEQQIAQELNPNPDRLPWATDLPEALYVRGECDRAIELLLRVVESHPNDAQTHGDLAACYQQKGMQKAAIEELGRTAELYGYPETGARVRRAFATSGYQGALRQWAQEIEQLQATGQVYFPAYLASVYGLLGDKDRAFYWLEEAYKFRNGSGIGTDLIHWLKTDPGLELIRSDPRYFDLLHRLGLSP